MSKTIKCPYCGHKFKESGWSKAGRYGIYTAEGIIKIGAQLAVDILMKGRGSVISNMAGRAAEGVTGDPNKFNWGDLLCPKCNKNLGNP
ncbi:MAG: hypothetical protein HDS69_09660 [Bacteroidales bacterium]|nr:hypothetical protein [Bacteroidales bacterium]